MGNHVRMPVGTQGQVLQAPMLDWANGQKVAISGSSAQSAAVDASAVVLISDTDCFIKMGTNPTAADAADSLRLPFDQMIVLGINNGDKIAVIQDSAAGSLYIVPVQELS